MKLATFQYEGRTYVGEISADQTNVAPFELSSDRAAVEGVSALIDGEIAMSSDPIAIDQVTRAISPLNNPTAFLLLLHKYTGLHVAVILSSTLRITNASFVSKNITHDCYG